MTPEPLSDQPDFAERHRSAYRAVLDYCSHGIEGIGPFEAEELVRLVERAHGLAAQTSRSMKGTAMADADTARGDLSWRLAQAVKAALREHGSLETKELRNVIETALRAEES